jgi:hypothetical protein
MFGLPDWWALARQPELGGDPFQGFPNGGTNGLALDPAEAAYDRAFNSGMPESAYNPQSELQQNPLAFLLQNPQLLLDLVIMLALLDSFGKSSKGSGNLPSSQPWSGGGRVPGGWSNKGGAPGAPGAPGGAGGTNPGAGPGPTADQGGASGRAVDPHARTRWGSDLVPKQFGSGLSGIQESSGCGPLAAVGVARAMGKNPDVQQTFQLASTVGWNGAGMNGPANYVRLLDKMGVPAHLEGNSSPDAIRKSVESGRPVTISTAKHYFLASDYDAKTGRFFVGNSGTAMRAGKEWMTLDEISGLGGGINGTVFVDGR